MIKAEDLRHKFNDMFSRSRGYNPKDNSVRALKQRIEDQNQCLTDLACVVGDLVIWAEEEQQRRFVNLARTTPKGFKDWRERRVEAVFGKKHGKAVKPKSRGKRMKG